MIEYKHQFRVAYPDTDKMGTVHHSVYPKYYEIARWELFRSIGISYKLIEDRGYMIPVLGMNFKFIKTTHYDELLTVVTTLKSVKGVRLVFSYQLYNENNELINEAETDLAFVVASTWKPCAVQDFVLHAIQQHSRKQVLSVSN